MRTPPFLGLRFCARVLGGMAEGNPRVIENGHWQRATEGIAGLCREMEGMRGEAEIAEAVGIADLGNEAEAGVAEAAPENVIVFEDPRQLRLGIGDLKGVGG